MAISSIAASGAVKTAIAVTVALQPAAAHHVPASVTVKTGDSLSSIAQKEYGSSADWPALWWINRHSVRNPSVLRAGQRLHLSSWHPRAAWLTRAAMAAMPAPAPVAAAPVATTPAPATFTGSSGSYQSCVIQVESGGNASAVNPYTGAGGLYGFLPSTWQALGYSGLPQNAPVSVQNAAFAKEYAQSGGSAWSPYDGC